MAGPGFDVVLQVVGGLFHVALAAFLIRIRTQRAATRAFAGFLLLQGAFMLIDSVNTYANSAGDRDLAYATGRWSGPFLVAAAIPAVMFVLLYPRARIAPTRRAELLWAGAALAVIVAGVLVEGLTTRVVQDDAVGLGRLNQSPAGLGMPLLFAPAAGVLALVLGLARFREPDVALRRHLDLVAIGFATLGAITIGAAVLLPGRWPATGLPSFLAPIAVASRALLGVAIFAVWAIHARESRAARVLLGLFAIGVLAGALPVVRVDGWRVELVWLLALQFLCRLVLPALATYALVRHQLFDIDLTIKWSIRRGSLAAVFLGVFFVVAQLAQNYFSTTLGWIYGGVAAGLLLFALTPLQRMAERIADRAMPDVRNTEDYRAQRKLESYRFVVRVALADGILTAEEEKRLAGLQEDLGIAPGEALEIRQTVARELGLDRITVQT